jgi:hypothetical protein
MKIARNKPTAANLRSWRVIIMRSRGEYLGSVEAPESRASWGCGHQAKASSQVRRAERIGKM